MGTFYDRIAGIKTVYNRFNSGTAYGHISVGNSFPLHSFYGLIRQVEAQADFLYRHTPVQELNDLPVPFLVLFHDAVQPLGCLRSHSKPCVFRVTKGRVGRRSGKDGRK